MRKKRAFCLIISALLVVGTARAEGQKVVKEMSLDQVLNLADKQSLDAFKAKNMYLSAYWEFKSYQAGLLPNLSLNMTPASYNRSMVERYDSQLNQDVFRPQQSLWTYSDLSLTQNIGSTGGIIYIDSDISRLVNYGADHLKTYSVTPIRIGLKQPLNGYNDYKWAKKISPMKYEKEKQTYVQSLQDMKIKGTTLFFNLVLAKIKVDMAHKNILTSDSMLAAGKQRFGIVAIQKDELLNLELSRYNAEVNLAEQEKELKKSRFNLNSFLGFNENTEIEPIVPEFSQRKEVDEQVALEAAQKQNPTILDLKQKQLESEQTLDKTIKESKVTASINASYGLNQESDHFKTAYKAPMSQEVVALQLNVPILDWGSARGKRQMAQKNKEAVDIEVKQGLIDFDQQVRMKVLDFNLQGKQILFSAKADSLARMVYDMTKKKFLLGKADMVALNSAVKAWMDAKENYVNSVYTYWQYYYELQQLTLFDFKTNRTLSEDFDAEVGK